MANVKYTITNERRNRTLAYARRLHLQKAPASVPFRWRVTSTKPLRDGTRPTPVLGAATWAEREALIRELRAHGWNYFVRFCDVNAHFALQYAKVDWVGEGRAYTSEDLPWRN